MAIINFLVEGGIDEAVARNLVSFTGHESGDCFGRRGCGYIKKTIKGFNLSARGSYFLAFVDFMDTKLACPGEVVDQWLPHRNKKMLFRVVVREIESWLLADTGAVAAFFNVEMSLVPTEVENLTDPKQSLINIARRSRIKNLRDSIVPVSHTTAREGILYNPEIIRFVREFWNPEEARINSQSLDKCIQRLEEIEI